VLRLFECAVLGRFEGDTAGCRDTHLTITSSSILEKCFGCLTRHLRKDWPKERYWMAPQPRTEVDWLQSGGFCSSSPTLPALQNRYTLSVFGASHLQESASSICQVSSGMSSTPANLRAWCQLFPHKAMILWPMAAFRTTPPSSLQPISSPSSALWLHINPPESFVSLVGSHGAHKSHHKLQSRATGKMRKKKKGTGRGRLDNVVGRDCVGKMRL